MWGNHYYKVGQLYYNVGQTLLQSRVASLYYKVDEELLQSGAGITKWGKHYYKVGQLRVITKWVKNCYKVEQIIHYKVGQSLLQSRTVHLRNNRTNGSYYIRCICLDRIRWLFRILQEAYHIFLWRQKT